MASRLSNADVKLKYDKAKSIVYNTDYKNKINEIFVRFFPRLKRNYLNTYSTTSSGGRGNRGVGNGYTTAGTNKFGAGGRNTKSFNNNVSNVGVDLASTRRENIINEIFGSNFELAFRFKDTTRIKFKRRGYIEDDIKNIERVFLGVVEENILSVVSNSNYRETRDTVIGQLDSIGSTCEIIEKSVSGKYIFTPVNMLDVTCYPIAGGMEDIIFIDRYATYLDFTTWLKSTYGVEYVPLAEMAEDEVIHYAIYQIPEYMIDKDEYGNQTGRWIYHYGIFDTEKGEIIHSTNPEIYKHIILAVVNRDQDNYLGWGVGDEKGNDVQRIMKMQHYHDINVARTALPVVYKNSKLVKNTKNRALIPGSEIPYSLPEGERISDNLHVLPEGNSTPIANSIEMSKKELMKGEQFPSPEDIPSDMPATMAYYYRQDMIINRSNRTIVIKKSLVDPEMMNILRMMKRLEGTNTLLERVDIDKYEQLLSIGFDIEREEFEVIVMGELERAKNVQNYRNTMAVMQAGGEYVANVVDENKFVDMLIDTHKPLPIFGTSEERKQKTEEMTRERGELQTAQEQLMQEQMIAQGQGGGQTQG